MDGVGDGVSRGGLVGHWDPGSLTGNGDALFPCGLGDLGSALLAIFVSVFEYVPRWRMEDFCDVATSASLSAAAELCFESLCTKTRKLLRNTTRVE